VKALIAKIRERLRTIERPGADALATLILAAREDEAFRRRLTFVLRLPPKQREALVRTAVDEMRLQGEPAEARAAFVSVATEEGAAIALRLLREK
jgi:hypothetical protein